MTQGVPGWELDEISDTPNLAFHAQPNTQPNPPHQPIDLHYEVAELTWENGHLAMHSLGLPRPGTAAAVEAAAAKSSSKYGTWEKQQAGGTLESIVNQAAKSTPAVADDDENILPWFESHRDALVPSSHQTISADEQHSSQAVPAAAAKLVASSSGSVPRKRRGGGRTPASSSSPENTSFTELAAGDHDASSSRSRPSLRGKGEMEKKGMNQSRSSTGTKRSRAAAVHNQSERKRRDRINQRIMTLQKLVPNSTKTDKASMLDEVIEYLKQLQAQIQFMSKMSSIPQMMLPVTMQQMQLSVMAQMGMGMGMGIMDMNTMVLSGHPACMPPVVHPSAAMAFFPPNMAAAWDGSSDRLGTVRPAVVADPMAAFLASQTQPMSMEAYNSMVALCQHLHQQSGPSISCAYKASEII